MRLKAPYGWKFPFLALAALMASGGAALADDCARPAEAATAARANAVTLWKMPHALFDRPETGWAIYAPLMRRTVETACKADTPAFASALRRWQQRRGLVSDGKVSEAVLQAMKREWQGRRRVTANRAPGYCPPPPPESGLAKARPEEGYGGKVVQLRPGALEAYRRMVRAAREEVPAIRRDGRALTIFSAYRSPDYDAAHCARDGNCDGVRRAACSPHRTGLVMDLYVGQAPGFGPDSTANANRYVQSRTEAYQWLVDNAHRFGFTNYAFEPWHWEWTGEAP